MKRTLLFVVLLSFFNGNCWAQVTRTKKVESDGFVWYQLWEWRDDLQCFFIGAESESGKTLIPIGNYGVCYHFTSGGWFGLFTDDSQGAYTKAGRCIVPLSRGYSSVSFSLHGGGHGGHCIVKRNGKEGVCDINGREIIVPKYDNAYGGYNCYIVYLNGKVGAFDINGKEIIAPYKYDGVSRDPNLKKNYYEVHLNGKEGACDLSGREVVPTQYEYVGYNKDHGFLGEGKILGIKLDEQGLAYSYTPSNGTNGTASFSFSRTYYDALAFDLKGHVKSCIVENNVNDSKTSKYEFKTTGEASLITINGMRIPLSVIRRDSSKKIQGLVGFGPDEDGFEIYKYHYNSNGTLKTLEKIIPEFALLLGSGTTVDYEYNSKGILIAEKDVLRETKFNVLEVDSHNNWTKRTYKKEVYTIFGPDTATVTETRTIEYW